MSCVGGPQGKPLRWRVARSNLATLAPNVGLLRPGPDTEGLPKTALEPPAMAEDRQRRPAEERGGSAATATGNRLWLASPGSSLEQPRPVAPLPGDKESKAPCSRRRWGGIMPCRPGGGGGPTEGCSRPSEKLPPLPSCRASLRAHPASPCNQLAQRHLRQMKQQPQASGLWDGGRGWGWRVTLRRCGDSGVWGVVFIFL